MHTVCRYYSRSFKLYVNLAGSFTTRLWPFGVKEGDKEGPENVPSEEAEAHPICWFKSHLG